MNQANMDEEKNEMNVLTAFINYVDKFLEMLQETFDTCPLIKKYRDQFLTVVKPYSIAQEKLCTSWHSAMKDYYQSVTDKDYSPFIAGKIPFLNEIDFKSKWTELNDPTVYTSDEIDANIENFAGYIKTINKFACIYNSLPSKSRKIIESVTQDIAKKIQNGSMNLADIDILAIGQQVFSTMDDTTIDTLLSNGSGLLSAVGGKKIFEEMKQGGLNIPNNVMDILNQKPIPTKITQGKNTHSNLVQPPKKWGQ